MQASDVGKGGVAKFRSHHARLESGMGTKPGSVSGVSRGKGESEGCSPRKNLCLPHPSLSMKDIVNDVVVPSDQLPGNSSGMVLK